MLTVGWILAPLALGAVAVDALSCSQGGCSLGNDERLIATLLDAAEVMDELGFVDGASPERDRGAMPTGAELFSPGSTARVIETLAVSAAAASLQAADVGFVIVEPSICTACLMCAQICPTNALHGEGSSEVVRLDFDPRLCVACGQCVTQCPERQRGAIRVTRGFDLSDWSRGRREVRRDTAPLCEVCGSPVAPASMLARIGVMLGEEHAATLDIVGRRCIDCRGR
jgi:ferredoxin